MLYCEYPQGSKTNHAISFRFVFYGLCHHSFSIYSEDFNNVLSDESGEEKQPALPVYQVASRLMLIWKLEEHREQFEKLCRYIINIFSVFIRSCHYANTMYVSRYLISSLECESARFSYVGIALNKEHALQWIAHMKVVLTRCLTYLKTFKLERAADNRSIMLLLHTLVAFTSTSTWAVVRTKLVEPLRPGLNQLCANIMGHLTTQVCDC